MSDFRTDAFQRARSLLTEMVSTDPAAIDLDTVVTVWLAGGGPTTYLELTYTCKDDWFTVHLLPEVTALMANMEPPDRAVFVHHDGSDEFRYQYPSDELDTLMERLNTEPEDDEHEHEWVPGCGVDDCSDCDLVCDDCGKDKDDE